LPFCHLTLKAKKPVSREKYPDFMRTWGDYIKVRRLDLKLTKRQLSLRFNVSDVTTYLWERNKVKPSLTQIPKIIEFLGYNPYETPFKSLGEKIMSFRRIHGLSRKKLAMLVGIDHSTIKSWERGEHSPREKTLNKLMFFVDSCPSNPDQALKL
jgi:transcriptional regulator with XRE-family HTH domain